MNYYLPRKSAAGKYGAKRTERAGYSFASKLEAAVFDMLKLQEKAGEISSLQCQVQVRLTDAGIIYKPDFKFFDERLRCDVYAEAKGYETAEWRIKLRLWRSYGPGLLRIYKGSAARITLADEIVPRGKNELTETDSPEP
jgi:hypothetical protein